MGNDYLETLVKQVQDGRFLDWWALQSGTQEDRDAAFDLCNEIRVEGDCPPYTREKFDEGLRFRHIFDEDYHPAEEEFVNLVFGWW